MSEPNPYTGDNYLWGPAQPPGTAPGYGYPTGAPGYGYPSPGPAPAGMVPPYPGMVPPHNGGPLLSIGDITVLPDRIVTPAGELPLKGAVWNVTDMSRTEEKIPTHAIVLAVVFFVFCFLGLLFLLIKEKTTVGFIQVSVTSGGRHHMTMIPTFGPHTLPQVMAQINYARSLSA